MEIRAPYKCTAEMEIIVQMHCRHGNHGTLQMHGYPGYVWKLWYLTNAWKSGYHTDAWHVWKCRAPYHMHDMYLTNAQHIMVPINAWYRWKSPYHTNAWKSQYHINAWKSQYLTDVWYVQKKLGHLIRNGNQGTLHGMEIRAPYMEWKSGYLSYRCNHFRNHSSYILGMPLASQKTA